MTLRTSVFIAASLDGFISRENGDIDWLDGAQGAGEDHGYYDFIDSIDVLVMGRGTYEKVLTFGAWPFTGRRVVVLSTTLRQHDLREDLRESVTVHPGPVDAAFMEWLRDTGASHAYVDGGKVIQSFISQDLLDDMIVTRIPVLLGTGLPLFGAVPADTWWEHVETRAFSSGLVQSAYRRVRGRVPQPTPGRFSGEVSFDDDAFEAEAEGR